MVKLTIGFLGKGLTFLLVVCYTCANDLEILDMKKLIRKLQGMTLMEWTVVVAIAGILLAIVMDQVRNDYSGHPATHRDSGVVEDVRHNVSEVVEVCHEGELYIVHRGRLVSLDERC